MKAHQHHWNLPRFRRSFGSSSRGVAAESSSKAAVSCSRRSPSPIPQPANPCCLNQHPLHPYPPPAGFPRLMCSSLPHNGLWNGRLRALCQRACGGTPTNPLCVPHGSGDGGKVGGAIGRLISIQIQGTRKSGSGGQYSVFKYNQVQSDRKSDSNSCQRVSLFHTRLLVKGGAS